MPNFKVREFNTEITTYRVNANNKQEAINKIAHADLITKIRHLLDCSLIKGPKTTYRVKEGRNNGKAKVKTIAIRTQEETLTTT